MTQEKAKTVILEISDDGMITLPSEMLNHMGVYQGERVDVQLRPDRELELKAAWKDKSGARQQLRSE